MFFFSSRRRHTRYWRDWSSDVCSSDLSTGYAVRNIAKGKTLLRTQTLFTLQLLTLIGNLTSLLICIEHMESVARSRRSVQTEDNRRLGGGGWLNALIYSKSVVSGKRGDVGGARII